MYKKPKPSKDDADPVLADFATDSIKCYDMDKNPHIKTVSADLSDPEVHGACQLALAAWKVLHCRDAGRIDMRYEKMEKDRFPTSWKYVTLSFTLLHGHPYSFYSPPLFLSLELD